MVDTIRTETALLSNLFQDGQANFSITAQDMRDLIVSLRANQYQAWAFYVDGTRTTQGTAQSFTADTRAKLLCDGSSGLTTTTEIQRMTGIWDTTNSLIKPTLSHGYDLRVSFKAQTATGGASNYFVLDLDIGAGGIGTGPRILEDTRPLIKQQGVAHSYVFSWPMFALAPFPTNGGALYLESNVALDVWDVRIYITHIYAPNA